MSALHPRTRAVRLAGVLFAVLLGLPATTWAGPAPAVVGGVPIVVPANNDVLAPGDPATLGAQVFVRGAGELGAEVTAEFLGAEAGFTNRFFFGGGAAVFGNQGLSQVGDAVSFQGVENGPIPFWFATSGGGSPAVSDNRTNADQNDASASPNFLVAATSDPRCVDLGFNDGGGDPDDADLDDLVVRLCVTVDSDADGVPDGAAGDPLCTTGQTQGCADNCPLVSNADQLNSDADPRGDVCQEPGTATSNQHKVLGQSFTCAVTNEEAQDLVIAPLVCGVTCNANVILTDGTVLVPDDVITSLVIPEFITLAPGETVSLTCPLNVAVDPGDPVDRVEVIVDTRAFVDPDTRPDGTCDPADPDFDDCTESDPVLEIEPIPATAADLAPKPGALCTGPGFPGPKELFLRDSGGLGYSVEFRLRDDPAIAAPDFDPTDVIAASVSLGGVVAATTTVVQNGELAAVFDAAQLAAAFGSLPLGPVNAFVTASTQTADFVVDCGTYQNVKASRLPACEFPAGTNSFSLVSFGNDKLRIRVPFDASQLVGARLAGYPPIEAKAKGGKTDLTFARSQVARNVFLTDTELELTGTVDLGGGPERFFCSDSITPSN